MIYIICTGLQCFICGTQSDGTSNPVRDMQPDPCKETNPDWDQYTVTCPADDVCVKIVTKGQDKDIIQRGCGGQTVSYTSYPHRLGCGRLTALNYASSFEDGEVACFCDTDYCNHQARVTSFFFTNIILPILSMLIPLQRLLYL